MKVDYIIIVFLSLWAILDALFSPSVDIFFTILLIGTLICLEIGNFFINKKSKEILKSINYLLMGIFVFIVINKIYNIIK
ncbi:hypothetical protein ACO3TA_02900 [Methanocaldococcus sp. 28A]